MNKIFIIGNLGKDPQIRTFDSGTKMAQITVGVTERGYTRNDGTKVPEQTDWFDVECWAGLATLAEKYLTKGMKVAVTGKMRSHIVEKNNEKRVYWAIRADDVEILTPKAKDAQNANMTPNFDNEIDNGNVPF